MHRRELLTSTLGAAAFALTFHTDSCLLRLLSALVALLATVRLQQSETNPLWSWFLGTAAMLGCYAWMIRIAPHFFHVDTIWGAGIWILFSAYEGSIFFFVHLLNKSLKRYPLFALPTAWLIVPFLFPHIIPWSWANLFLDLKPLVLSVAVFGSSIFTLLLFLLGTTAFARSKKGIRLAVSSLLVLILASTFQARSILERETTAATLKVGIVQSNLDPERDFKPEKRLENVIKQRELSAALLNQRIDLLVWPESSVHFDYPVNLKQLASTSLAHPFPDLSVPLLFGTQTLLPEKTAKGEPIYYFSALLLGPNGIVAGRYDKHRLLPFAERVPFANYLPSLNSILPSGYELRLGEGKRTIAVPQHANSSLAIGICYEDLFSETYQQSAEPTLLLALSNDAWFLDSEAARQHYFLSRLRAVEQGKYFLRITMNGVSALVSPFGDEVLRLPELVPASVVIETPLL